MIISGGILKGRTIKTAPVPGLRPTSGKVRQALFNMIAGEVHDARFLDLFAGSGAVGLEAASRGASSVELVENNPVLFRLLTENCRVLAPEAARPIRIDVSRFCAQSTGAGRNYDIVFADPPFSDDFNHLVPLLKPLTAPSGLLIIQFPGREPPKWLESADKTRKYGESGLAFFYT